MFSRVKGDLGRNWAVQLLSAVVLFGILFAPVVAQAAPPPTRVEVVTDTLHGVVIEDPYRWLEDQEAPETREWIKNEPS